MLNYWIKWKYRWTADRQFTPSLSTWPSMRLSLKNFSLSLASTSPPVGWTSLLWRLGPLSQERWFWVLIHQELCKRYKLSPDMAATTTYLEELYTRNLSKEVNNVHWTVNIEQSWWKLFTEQSWWRKMLSIGGSPGCVRCKQGQTGRFFSNSGRVGFGYWKKLRVRVGFGFGFGYWHCIFYQSGIIG